MYCNVFLISFLKKTQCFFIQMEIHNFYQNTVSIFKYFSFATLLKQNENENKALLNSC